ncbi:MAG: class A beta-lactamase-related serine hydrolase [Actinomycetia bacterium]|nr:class A beta-lactamase-related serine hydrolase [Actinomycetes bacterium]
MSTEQLRRELRGELSAAGLAGSFLVRDLVTGDEAGIDPDTEFPAASLAKLPLAVAVATRTGDGRLDGAAEIRIMPGQETASGPAGLSRFRHPARICVDDLLYLSTSLSDNTAADVLFGLVPPADVEQDMRAAGITGLTVRHRMGTLTRTPAERFPPGQAHLAHALSIGARTPGRGHPVPQLDISRASSGSARAYADLLQALWTPSLIPAGAAARVRSLLAGNVIRHRLAPDFTSDSLTWSSKTGTLLNLRHEAGVAEHDDGSAYAVVALTESQVPAAAQPAADWDALFYRYLEARRGGAGQGEKLGGLVHDVFRFLRHFGRIEAGA